MGLPPGEPEINCEELSGFDYGAVPATTCSAEHVWTIVNLGTANLSGTVALTGNDAAEFEFTQGSGEFNLSPSGEHTVGVRFCPDTLGDKVATLEISSNDADENPCTLALSGQGEECAAVRDLAVLWPSYCGDDPKPVEIDIAPPPEAIAIVVEDQPPAGWAVSDISEPGVWDPINEKVKWGPFFAPDFPTQVSYTVTPPPGTEGEHCFVGVISIDGVNEEICGNACVDGPTGAFIPADQPQPPYTGCGDCSCATCEDGRVEACEMSGYACAWKRGCNDDLAGMTRSAYVWMRGECYCWDGVDENWYLTDCPPPRHSAASAAKPAACRGAAAAQRGSCRSSSLRRGGSRW